MTDDELSRRSALRLGAGGLAAATAGGLAGCSSVPFIGGGGGDAGSSKVRKWAFKPGYVGQGDPYRARYLDLSAIDDASEHLANSYVEEASTDFEQYFGEPLGVERGDETWTMALGKMRVGHVTHSVSDAVATVESKYDFTEDEKIDGYTTVVGSESRVGFALDGSTVIFVRVFEEPRTALENLIRTRNGDIDRYAADEEFGPVVDAVDGDDVIAEEASNIDGVVAEGSGATFQGETTKLLSPRVYKSKSDYDREKIQSDVDELDDVSVTFAGSVVKFESEIATADYNRYVSFET